MCSKIKSPDQFNNLVELVSYFKDEKTCLSYLEEGYWGGEMRCPYCGYDKPYRFKNGIRFECRNCKEGFTAKIGTIFECSKLPMVKWFMAIYLVTSHKKGISSVQLSKDVGVTQKTAWFMLHRIRESMKQNTDKLSGTIEIDESFVGGKNKNRHKDKKVTNSRFGRSFQDKTPVFGMICRQTGEARAIVIPDVSGDSIQPLIKIHIKKGSTIYTDDWSSYGDMKRYNTASVCHGKGQYREGDCYTNTIENFWSQLKRMMIGCYNWVYPRHLHRYVNELTFRFNTRLYTTAERLKLFFSRVNCRITYKKLISQS